MSHSCIKREIKKFTNCNILKILRQMWRFQKRKICESWNIQCRSIMSHIYPPKALFIQIFMILHQCHFISAICLSKLFFKMTTFTLQGQVRSSQTCYCNNQWHKDVRGPWGKQSHLERGGKWEKKTDSWHQTVEEVRCLQDFRRHGGRVRQNTKAPLCTEYVSLCMSCAIIGCTLEIVIVNRVLLCLFVSGE